MITNGNMFLYTIYNIFIPHLESFAKKERFIEHPNILKCFCSLFLKEDLNDGFMKLINCYRHYGLQTMNVVSKL